MIVAPGTLIGLLTVVVTVVDGAPTTMGEVTTTWLLGTTTGAGAMTLG